MNSMKEVIEKLRFGTEYVTDFYEDLEVGDNVRLGDIMDTEYGMEYIFTDLKWDDQDKPIWKTGEKGSYSYKPNSNCYQPSTPGGWEEIDIQFEVIEQDMEQYVSYIEILVAITGFEIL